MSIGPPQASSIRTSRKDGKRRRSPAAARAVDWASSVNAGPIRPPNPARPPPPPMAMRPSGVVRR